MRVLDQHGRRGAGAPESARSAPAPAKFHGVGAGPMSVHRALLLQPLIGNAALAGLVGEEVQPAPAVQRDVGASTGVVVQRTPAKWAVSPQVEAVRRLDPQTREGSSWSRVRGAVLTYAGLGDDDAPQRQSALDKVVRELHAWHDAHRRTKFEMRPTKAKRSALEGLREVIEEERAELRERESGRPEAANPRAVLRRGGASRNPPPSSSRRTFGASASSTPPLLPRDGRALDELLPERTAANLLPPGVEHYTHLTGAQNVGGIHRQGIVPGRGSGIGTDPGRPGIESGDPSHFYVLSGSDPRTTQVVHGEARASDTGGFRAVGVLRGPSTAIDRDHNYKRGASRFFAPSQPARHADEAEYQPISYVAPVRDGAELDGATSFINRHRRQEDAEYTPRTVRGMLNAHVRDQLGGGLIAVEALYGGEEEEERPPRSRTRSSSPAGRRQEDDDADFRFDD